MWKQLGKNKKALSSLALILLLLVSAIIGGLISYLWVMGYYISLKEKIPEENTVAITDLGFYPQNATAFNMTVLNPTWSPDDKIQVEQIALREETETTLQFVTACTPGLPFNITRGNSQTFTCISDWTPYMNQTVVVSVFVKDGSGSTRATNARAPYTRLLLDNYDFNPNLGVRNFTLTFRNSPLSATYLNITKIQLRITPPINFTTLLQPMLPVTLYRNNSRTFVVNYNWLNESRIGGGYAVDVETLQGYNSTYPIQIPQLAFTVQGIKFDPADTTHFDVNVTNQVSTNTYLNVSRIESQIGNSTWQVTPPLNSSTNGVLGNSTATFKCDWNWTNYRNTNVIVTVYMLQGINESGQQSTSLAALLSIPKEPVFPDTQHFFVSVKNSQYSIKAANVTKIEVQLENGTTITVSPVYPPLGSFSIGIGQTTMLNCSWNWGNYLNKSITVFVYTNETSEYNIFRIARTPANASSYHIYLAIPSPPNLSPANTTRFDVQVRNKEFSDRNATIARIAVLLENGTEINATCISETLPYILQTNITVTFTCEWTWTTYRNKNVIILIYTDEGPKAFYIAKTPP